jgi:hypothetical protein
MNRRMSHMEDEKSESKNHREPQPIGEILSELMAQYQARFPAVHIRVVETPAAT